MKERRTGKRIAIRIPIKWKSERRTKENLTNALLFDTRNITRGGLFLKTVLRPKKGSRVELELKISKTAKPLKLNGRIAWIAEKRKHPYLYPGVGIEFAKISRKDCRKLNTFLKNKFDNFRDALELKNMYVKLKDMAARLVQLEERHSSAVHFKNVLDNAINEIDDVAHILDKEINEVKEM